MDVTWTTWWDVPREQWAFALGLGSIPERELVSSLIAKISGD